MDRPLPRRQFRILYRAFLSQLVDLELLPAGGDPSRLLVQIAALLGSLSFILAILVTAPYRTATPAQIAAGAWGDQEFLISTTLAAVGFFTVLVWDSISLADATASCSATCPFGRAPFFRRRLRPLPLDWRC